MKHNDILIAGIGGQGTVLASRLIAVAAMEKGSFVRTAETIGMAQRGGSVVSHVRIESENKSSLIPFGTADTIIAFEATEALRSLPRLKKGGCLIVNKRSEEAPIEGLPENTVYADAHKPEFVKAVNTVLIGAAISHGFIDFEYDFMVDVMKKIMPAKFIELNIKALTYGGTLK